jgi:hypothetical protein
MASMIPHGITLFHRWWGVSAPHHLQKFRDVTEAIIAFLRTAHYTSDIFASPSAKQLNGLIYMLVKLPASASPSFLACDGREVKVSSTRNSIA